MHLIANETFDLFDITKKMSLGVLFDGMSEEQIFWKLIKAHKNNDKQESKQYVVHGFYYGIYIGEFHFVVDGDDYSIKPLNLEPAKCQ